MGSKTKTFAGRAWGLLLEDGRLRKLATGKRIDLDSLAYDHIVEDESSGSLDRASAKRSDG
jgi:hypothetical protein